MLLTDVTCRKGQVVLLSAGSQKEGMKHLSGRVIRHLPIMVSVEEIMTIIFIYPTGCLSPLYGSFQDSLSACGGKHRHQFHSRRWRDDDGEKQTMLLGDVQRISLMLIEQDFQSALHAPQTL